MSDDESLFWAGAPITVRSDMFHVYRESNGRSLCGKYRHGTYNEKSPVTDDDSYREGRDCKKCSRKAGVLDDQGDVDGVEA